jgi:hypothetical protein
MRYGPLFQPAGARGRRPRLRFALTGKRGHSDYFQTRACPGETVDLGKRAMSPFRPQEACLTAESIGLKAKRLKAGLPAPDAPKLCPEATYAKGGILLVRASLEACNPTISRGWSLGGATARVSFLRNLLPHQSASAFTRCERFGTVRTFAASRVRFLRSIRESCG